MGLLDWLSRIFGWRPKPAPVPAPPPAPEPDPGLPQPAGWQTALLELHNEYRVGNGKWALSLAVGCELAAQRHADWMAANGTLTHQGDGDTGSRLAGAGYSYSGWGENIAYGYATPGDVFRGWANSPGHRANILAAFHDVGFGQAPRGGVVYWCAVFAVPAGRHAMDAACMTHEAVPPGLRGPDA